MQVAPARTFRGGEQNIEMKRSTEEKEKKIVALCDVKFRLIEGNVQKFHNIE